MKEAIKGSGNMLRVNKIYQQNNKRGKELGKMHKNDFSFAAVFIFLFIQTAFAGQLLIGSVNYNPIPAQAGENLFFWARIDNNINADAKDAMLKISLSYPLSLEPGKSNTVELGDLSAWQSSTVSFNLRVAPEALDGNYDVVLSTSESAGIGFSKTVNVKVLRRSPKIELIESTLSRAEPGQEITTNLILKNIGFGKAQNIIVKLEEDRTVTTTGIVVERKVKPVGSATLYVKELSPGETAVVPLTLGIDADAAIQTYMVPLKIYYADSTGKDINFTSTSIGLTVIGAQKLDAVAGHLEPIAYPGAESEISIDLFNTGVGSARFVVAELQAEFAEIESSKVFIGTLEADGFDSFKTKLRIAGNAAPGTQPITLKLTYVDESNETRVEAITLNVRVYSIQEAQSISGAQPSIWFYIALLLALFIAGKFAYRRFAKKK